jgi:hypothetical protein
MGFAAVQWSETEDVDMTIERDAWTDEATVTVRLYPQNGYADVETIRWHGPGSGRLTDSEAERARNAAWRKRDES